MLTKLHIQNYRSIADATIALRPFTMLVGANGSGKSNLLRLLRDLSGAQMGHGLILTPHLRSQGAPGIVELESPTGAQRYRSGDTLLIKPKELTSVTVFSIDAQHVGSAENLVIAPFVHPNGQGTVQVLDSLKTGDREDLFETIERYLRDFVPEIEKLSFAPGQNAKRLQVRETGIPVPVPVSELSEGTRLVLTILTIVHQERKPSIICIEDLDRGLHPALFGKVVDLCRALVRTEDAPQIIATTHNPYLVDQFIDDEESVILVEKTNGDTTFTSLRVRLAGLDHGSDTLGGVWYSGLVGGVPLKTVKHLPGAEPKPAA